MVTTGTTKIKYLTNKDLLEEIHKSKLSYCSFTDPKYTSYDFIVPNIKKITKKKINDARRKRFNELKSLHKKQYGTSKKVKPPTLSSIAADSIVIRVMTYDHIPLDPIKAETGKTEAEKHIKVNFPPFQHYIMKNNKLVCVLKSHWKDGLKSGEFCKEHGKMTNRLALMFMKLVDRYGHRGNWRGYTYLEEMKLQALLQLSQVGLQFDESRSETPNPFAYYTQTITNSFMRVLNIEKKNQNIRDDLLIMNGAAPSYTRQTEDHLKQQDPEGGQSKEEASAAKPTKGRRPYQKKKS
jgi:hypothetical protein